MENQKSSHHFFVSLPFSQLKGIKHAFFTRNLPGSNHVYVTHTFNRLGIAGPKEELIKRNCDIVIAHSPFPIDRLSILDEIHSNRAIVIGSKEQIQTEIQADGQVTNQPGLALAILAADCAPVLFADESNRVIGAAHAGWKGAQEGILENTLLEMTKLGGKKSQISALIGPCIHQNDYEVGPKFVQTFLQESSSNETFFKESTSSNRMLFDFPGYVSNKLKNAGLKEVHDIGLNTFNDEKNFFSFRASTLQGKDLEGNLISVIALANN